MFYVKKEIDDDLIINGENIYWKRKKLSQINDKKYQLATDFFIV